MSLLHSTHWAIGKIEELQQKEWLKNKKTTQESIKLFIKSTYIKGI